jgi:hypothetical protein
MLGLPGHVRAGCARRPRTACCRISATSPLSPVPAIDGNGSPQPSGSTVDSAGGRGRPREPALDLGSSARKLGQIFRSLICLTAHMRADPSTRLIVVETHFDGFFYARCKTRSLRGRPYEGNRLVRARVAMWSDPQGASQLQRARTSAAMIGAMAFITGKRSAPNRLRFRKEWGRASSATNTCGC